MIRFTLIHCFVNIVIKSFFSSFFHEFTSTYNVRTFNKAIIGLFRYEGTAKIILNLTLMFFLSVNVHQFIF